MERKADPAAVAEYVDRTCALQTRPVLQKITAGLYEAARKKQGQPLTYLAATKALSAVKAGDRVIVLSGNGHPSTLPRGETDGPVGAAALARAFALLGALPVVVSERDYLGPIVEPCKVGGLTLDGKGGFVEEFPLDDSRAPAAAKEILDKHSPKLLVTIEKLGPNAKGFRHNLRGDEKNNSNSRADYLVDGAKERGIPTVGVGDGGNELGLGLIYDDVRRIVKTGAKCQCPCGDGVATVTATDVLVIGAVSNWGAYGMEAMLSVLSGRAELMHDPVLEANMLAACVAAGGRDGPSGKGAFFVDGSGVDVQRNVVQALRTLVVNAINS